MEHLRVYQSPFSKRRVGSTFDGGYIMSEIPGGYDLLIGGGISDDTSFEDGILDMYPGLSAVMFDGTIPNLPATARNRDRMTFVRKNLGATNSATIDNLSSSIAGKSDIFLKLDIEGGEDGLFHAISDADLTKFKQIVIEFHSAHQVVIPTRLAHTHWLIHFHPNNCCGTRKVNGIDVPNVFECTYIRKTPGEAPLPFNRTPIPDPALDQRNVPSKPEISLRGAPYIHS
jgi:hypothetical protein